MKFKDLTVLIGVIGIILMLVLPIPSWLLDVLLVINISLALMILLVAMNTKEALEFSIFPALLLITTLFRLALNVSTTKLILGNDGNAGHVVETFGRWVAQDKLAVGFVVFLILVVVQFIVITKGAERVAEVGARFTLDAMPGKQMSIDADLNAGTINEHQAKERRAKIEKEADFYGAMDGASKFVKGDAIAGIIIVLINLIGGFSLGMASGKSFQDSLALYSVLTIGDGLVSQVPALLISTAAGLIVTRAASDKNFANQLSDQILSYPKLLYIVVGVVLILGIFTPIGLLATLPFAVLIFLAARNMERKLQYDQVNQEQQQEQEQIQEVRNPENVVQLLQVDPIEFEFGYGLIPLADSNQGGDLLDRIIMIRRQCAIELGIVIPVIRIRDNIQLNPNEYVIKIKGNVVAKGDLLLDHYLAMSSGYEDESIIGVATVEPAFGLPAKWIEESMKERAEISGYTVVDPPSIVITHLTETLKKHAHELVGRQETKALVDHFKERYPTLVDELIPSVLSLGDIQKVLSRLLREKVSIRDLATIFETLADHGQYSKDPGVLTEYVRQSLSRQITQQFTNPGEALRVITIGPALEKKIAENVQTTDQGSYVAFDPVTMQQVFQKISEQMQKLLQTGHAPILLTSPTIRMYLRQLMERMMQEVPVLSYSELEPNVEIQSAGMVNI